MSNVDAGLNTVLNSSVIHLNNIRDQVPLKLAPDAFAVITDSAFTYIVYSEGVEGSDGRGSAAFLDGLFQDRAHNTYFKKGFSNLNVSASVQSGSGSCSFSLVGPYYEDEDSYYVTKAEGNRVHHFHPMMEVQVFAKGRFPVKSVKDGTETIEDTPVYYRVFWGVAKSIEQSIDGQEATINITCSDILYFWANDFLNTVATIDPFTLQLLQNAKGPTTAPAPSGAEQSPPTDKSGTADGAYRFTNGSASALGGLNPWEIVATLFLNPHLYSQDEGGGQKNLWAYSPSMIRTPESGSIASASSVQRLEQDSGKNYNYINDYAKAMSITMQMWYERMKGFYVRDPKGSLTANTGTVNQLNNHFALPSFLKIHGLFGETLTEERVSSNDLNYGFKSTTDSVEEKSRFTHFNNFFKWKLSDTNGVIKNVFGSSNSYGSKSLSPTTRRTAKKQSDSLKSYVLETSRKKGTFPWMLGTEDKEFSFFTSTSKDLSNDLNKGVIVTFSINPAINEAWGSRVLAAQFRSDQEALNNSRNADMTALQQEVDRLNSAVEKISKIVNLETKPEDTNIEETLGVGIEDNDEYWSRDMILEERYEDAGFYEDRAKQSDKFKLKLYRVRMRQLSDLRFKAYDKYKSKVGEDSKKKLIDQEVVRSPFIKDPINTGTEVHFRNAYEVIKKKVSAGTTSFSDSITGLFNLPETRVRGIFSDIMVERISLEILESVVDVFKKEGLLESSFGSAIGVPGLYGEGPYKSGSTYYRGLNSAPNFKELEGVGFPLEINGNSVRSLINLNSPNIKEVFGSPRDLSVSLGSLTHLGPNFSQIISIRDSIVKDLRGYLKSKDAYEKEQAQKKKAYEENLRKEAEAAFGNVGPTVQFNNNGQLIVDQASLMKALGGLELTRAMGVFESFQPWTNLNEVIAKRPDFKSRLEIASSTAEKIGFELYQDLSGDIYFKPPFYNMDVASHPSYHILPADVISFSESENADDVFNSFEVKVPWSNITLPNSDEEKLVTTGIYFEPGLIALYGQKHNVVDLPVAMVQPLASDPDAVQRANDVMDCLASIYCAQSLSKIYSASATIAFRPEIRVGFPVYISHMDSYYYVTSVSHTYSPDGSAQTALTLEAKRDRVRYFPMKESDIDVKGPTPHRDAGAGRAGKHSVLSSTDYSGNPGMERLMPDDVMYGFIALNNRYRSSTGIDFSVSEMLSDLSSKSSKRTNGSAVGYSPYYWSQNAPRSYGDQYLVGAADEERSFLNYTMQAKGIKSNPGSQVSKMSSIFNQAQAQRFDWITEANMPEYSEQLRIRALQQGVSSPFFSPIYHGGLSAKDGDPLSALQLPFLSVASDREFALHHYTRFTRPLSDKSGFVHIGGLPYGSNLKITPPEGVFFGSATQSTNNADQLRAKYGRTK